VLTVVCSGAKDGCRIQPTLQPQGFFSIVLSMHATLTRDAVTVILSSDDNMVVQTEALTACACVC
jgi:hypothetical protein